MSYGQKDLIYNYHYQYPQSKVKVLTHPGNIGILYFFDQLSEYISKILTALKNPSE